MNQISTLLVSLSLLVSITCIGYSQPVMPPQPTPVSPSIGTPDAPNFPKGSDLSTLRREYGPQYVKLEKERRDLQLKFVKQSAEIAQAKQRVRAASTAFGKWLARRELQQQIENMDNILNRLDNIEEQQKGIRNSVRDSLNPRVVAPDKNPPSLLPPPGGDIPGLPPYRDMSDEQKLQRLEQLQQQQRDNTIHPTVPGNQQSQDSPEMMGKPTTRNQFPTGKIPNRPGR